MHSNDLDRERGVHQFGEQLRIVGSKSMVALVAGGGKGPDDSVPKVSTGRVWPGGRNGLRVLRTAREPPSPAANFASRDLAGARGIDIFEETGRISLRAELMTRTR